MILLLFTIIRITLKIKYGRKALADKEEKVIFGGRLGERKYYDMDRVIAAALERAEGLE